MIGIPRTTFGVRFMAGNVFPGYAKNADPGLMSLHAFGMPRRRRDGNVAPGGAFFATPGV